MRATLVAATALTTTLTAALSGQLLPAPASASSPTTTSSARLSQSQYDLYLNFNGSSGDTPDLSSSGSAPVSTSIASSDGGDVVAVRKGNGSAARLEPFDPEAPAPLGAVVVRPDGDRDPFAPRKGDFSFGALFNLDSVSEGSDVDNGNNLVQRGLYADDAQYKIQVDHQRVSCRVAGSGGAVQVKADVDVKPGVWHRVRCTRQGSSVKLVLVELTSNGPVSRSWTRNGSTGDLAFAKQPPLSVGGKVKSTGALVKASADQFNGRVDNVFFRSLGG